MVTLKLNDAITLRFNDNDPVSNSRAARLFRKIMTRMRTAQARSSAAVTKSYKDTYDARAGAYAAVLVEISEAWPEERML